MLIMKAITNGEVVKTGSKNDIVKFVKDAGVINHAESTIAKTVAKALKGNGKLYQFWTITESEEANAMNNEEIKVVESQISEENQTEEEVEMNNEVKVEEVVVDEVVEVVEEVVVENDDQVIENEEVVEKVEGPQILPIEEVENPVVGEWYIIDGVVKQYEAPVEEKIEDEQPPVEDEEVKDEQPKEDKKEEAKEEKPVNKRKNGKEVEWYAENGALVQVFPSIKAAATYMKEFLQLKHMPFTSIMKSIRQDVDWTIGGTAYSFRSPAFPKPVPTEKIVEKNDAPAAEATAEEVKEDTIIEEIIEESLEEETKEGEGQIA